MNDDLNSTFDTKKLQSTEDLLIKALENENPLIRKEFELEKLYGS